MTAAVLAVGLLGPGRGGALTRGTTGADFLKLSNGVRAVAMGDTYTAVAEDVYSVYWNPAGIANLEAPEAAGSGVKLFDQVEGVYLASGALELPDFPFATGNAAIGFMTLTTGSFDSTDPQALVRAAAGSASDNMVFATYALPVAEGLSAGGTFKLLERQLSGADPSSYVTDPVTGDSIPTRSQDFRALGVGIDGGMLWENLDRTLSLGGSVQNLGSMGEFGQGLTLGFGSGAEVLPITFRVGGAYRTVLWGQKLLATADLSSFIDSIAKPRLSMGAEYGLAGMAFLRLGWAQPLDSPVGKTPLDYGKTGSLSVLPTPLRTGFGFRMNISPTALFQLDYALAPFGTLGNVHQVSLLVRWDIPKTHKAITSETVEKVEKRKAQPAMTIQPKSIKFASPPKEWKVEITDDRGRVVKTFQGTGLPPKSLDWDGTDERGKVITGTRQFKMVLKAKDVSNHVVTDTSAMAAVSAQPQIKSVAGKPLYPEVVFALPQGNYQLWQLKVEDAGRLVRSWEGRGRPTSPLKWDGRDAAGNPTVLKAPKYAWQFVDEEGHKTVGANPLPQVEAEVKPETLSNRIRMIGVRFTGTETDITDEHRETLEKAAAFIAEHPESSLTIESYADAPGDDEANYQMARTRAERVLQTLNDDYRLNASRVTMRVYGRSKPAPHYPNLSDEAQRQRVDLVINVHR